MNVSSTQKPGRLYVSQKIVLVGPVILSIFNMGCCVVFMCGQPLGSTYFYGVSYFQRHPRYVQNGWWTYELCWPWHVRRMHYHTVAAPEAHVFRVLHTSEDSTQSLEDVGWKMLGPGGKD